MMELVRKGLTQLGVFAANPLAFLAVALYGAFWVFASPATFEWHAVATLATFTMTLLIQRATHRDTQALHAKLDELLHAQKAASNSLTHIDKEEPEDIERARTQAREDD
jgi:low affinity Fe/Cu permease